MGIGEYPTNLVVEYTTDNQTQGQRIYTGEEAVHMVMSLERIADRTTPNLREYLRKGVWDEGDLKKEGYARFLTGVTASMEFEEYVAKKEEVKTEGYRTKVTSERARTALLPVYKFLRGSDQFPSQQDGGTALPFFLEWGRCKIDARELDQSEAVEGKVHSYFLLHAGHIREEDNSIRTVHIAGVGSSKTPGLPIGHWTHEKSKERILQIIDVDQSD